MQPSLREIGRYYRRIGWRGLRDSRSAISRSGLIVGLGVALATAATQAMLDEEFRLFSAAIAACAGVGATALAVIAWHVIRAPVLIAAEHEQVAEARLQSEYVEWQRSQDEIAAALADSEAERQRLQGIADQQAPKQALIDQLRTAETVGPRLLLGSLRASREELDQRSRDDAAALRSWVFETQQLIKDLVPEYADQFVIKARLPYDLPFVGKGSPPPPPTVAELFTYRNEATAALRRIIRAL